MYKLIKLYPENKYAVNKISNTANPCNITLALINLLPHRLLNSPPFNIEIMPINKTINTAIKTVIIIKGRIEFKKTNNDYLQIKNYLIKFNKDNILSFPNKSITSSLFSPEVLSDLTV